MFQTVTVPAVLTYDGQIDEHRLADELKRVLDSLEGQGFELVSVQPVISGKSEDGLHGLNAGWGWGYSYTSAFIVVAHKPTEPSTQPPPPQRPVVEA